MGDLVRPRSTQFRDQVGVVLRVGFIGGVSVWLFSGRKATYNRGSLEVVSETR